MPQVNDEATANAAISITTTTSRPRATTDDNPSIVVTIPHMIPTTDDMTKPIPDVDAVSLASLTLADSSCSKTQASRDSATLKEKIVPSTGTTNSSSCTSTKSDSREVSFGTIRIRRYSMAIGDNPACGIGVPVQLSWDYVEDQLGEQDIDRYDGERRPRRRKLQHLGLSYYKRQDILRKAGYSEAELYQAEREVAKTRRQRKSTLMFLPVSRLEEVVESAGRKVKRAIGKDLS
jgi:hypothetical protein